MREFAVYMMNTDLITIINAAGWEIEDNTLVYFVDEQDETIAIFNVRNIVGFKEIKEDESE